MVISRGRAALLLVAALAACSSSGGDQVRAQARDHAPATGSAAAGSGAPVTAQPRVYLAVGSREVAVDVEVVDTEPLIQRGLMYRTFLPADAGMLFVPRVEQVWRFWMRNTLIPLDMIFIARDLTIAGIVENAVPHDETSRYVDRPSLYILEVNGGWAKAHGVTAGAKVRFEHVAAVDQ
jgi:uncharacterized membrane protein (UPF0127 family)